MQKPLSVGKSENLFLRWQRRIFRFSGDRCGGKTPYKRKTAYSAVFQGYWGVPTGIERSPKIFDFRASGIPVGERVDFFATLKRQDLLSCRFFYSCKYLIRFGICDSKLTPNLGSVSSSIVFFMQAAVKLTAICAAALRLLPFISAAVRVLEKISPVP